MNKLSLNKLIHFRPDDNKTSDLSKILLSPQVHFRDITETFIRYVKYLQPVCLFGALYHLCSPVILDFLIQSKIPCNFIVQKSSSWSKTTQSVKLNSKGRSRHRLRNMYDALTPIPSHLAAVKCLGSIQSAKNHSLMHHKFVLFMTHVPGDTSQTESNKHINSQLHPFCVWQGSFNFSTNAESSTEGVVLLSDTHVCEEFLGEFKALESFSEPLDWKSRHVLTK